jgi:peptidyl-prolyl cis-trans isomerase A (cyclophilin A)
MKIFKGIILLGLMGLVACGKSSAQGKSLGAQAMEKRIEALDDGLYAVIKTNRGDILVKLFYKETPLTAANFVGLAEGKLKNTAKEGPFYNGLTFHRVINNFMIQGGDPLGDGRGGPGYRFPDEIIEGIKFDRPGLLAMANAGPGTNGSQFFITHVATPHLNGAHTIFGEVVNGSDQNVVNAVRQGDTIESVIIIRKGAEAEAFTADQALFDKLNAEITEKARNAYLERNKANVELAQKLIPNALISPKGAFYIIEREGTGEKPQAGDPIAAHYEGKLLTTGQVFDSSYARNEPIRFPVGVGYVIPGWDEMLLDMRVGEKRLMVLPADIAYGSSGAGGVIPPDAWLVFEVELVSIDK